MINYLSIQNGIPKLETGTDFQNPENIIWVDLLAANKLEKEAVERTFAIELFTKKESEEIESSSKYIETEDEIAINLNFLRREDDAYESEPVSLILKDKILFTQRQREYKTFQDNYKRLKNLKPETGDDIFMSLIEIRIDFDADLIETITDQISVITKGLVNNKELERDILLKITSLQETTISIRENIVEKQRIISAILKSKIFPKEHFENMRIMIKDVSSLLEHTSFNFERLEFLQNTFLGLVDMEQNRVIKIFTIVTVIFMPPTLIASIYGMNFKYMPELDHVWGYPFAIVVMMLASAFTLLFFKRKKWL